MLANITRYKSFDNVPEFIRSEITDKEYRDKFGVYKEELIDLIKKGKTQKSPLNIVDSIISDWYLRCDIMCKDFKERFTHDYKDINNDYNDAFTICIINQPTMEKLKDDYLRYVKNIAFYIIEDAFFDDVIQYLLGKTNHDHIQHVIKEEAKDFADNIINNDPFMSATTIIQCCNDPDRYEEKWDYQTAGQPFPESDIEMLNNIKATKSFANDVQNHVDIILDNVECEFDAETKKTGVNYIDTKDNRSYEEILKDLINKNLDEQRQETP